MILLGVHGWYILAAYLVTIAAVGGLLLVVLNDYRAQARRIVELERAGTGRRRSNAAGAPNAATRPDWDV